MPQVEMIIFLILIIGMCVYGQDPASKVVSDRYAVYWNRTNPKRGNSRPVESPVIPHALYDPACREELPQHSLYALTNKARPSGCRRLIDRS
eukprot:superscaffoldBa00001046_g8668